MRPAVLPSTPPPSSCGTAELCSLDELSREAPGRSRGALRTAKATSPATSGARASGADGRQMLRTCLPHTCECSDTHTRTLIYTHMFTHTHSCARTTIYALPLACTYSHFHILAHTCTYTHPHMQTYILLPTHAHTHSAYLCTHADTYTSAYTHTHQKTSPPGAWLTGIKGKALKVISVPRDSINLLLETVSLGNKLPHQYCEPNVRI